MESTHKFKNDKHFEERIVQALIVDHKFSEQMLEVVDVEYFNLEYLKEIAKVFFGYYEKYSAFPSFKLLVGICKEEIQNQVLKEQVYHYFVKIKKEPLNGDLEYIKEQSLDFCKKRCLAIALETTLDLIEDKKYEQIIPIVQKALVIGSERDSGHNLVNDFEKRMVPQIHRHIPTPWPEINNITKGGPWKGKLCVICGSTGTGKSHLLVDIGYHCAYLGYNVLHYTFELDEMEIGKRYDARASGIHFDHLEEHKEEVWESLKKIQGAIIIKSYPTKTATTLTLKNHIHKMAIMDIKPDIILVDYGDLMRSSKKYNERRHEEECVFEELRTLATELEVPIWTATQTNREALDADVVTLKHVSESFGKAKVCDFFMTIARKKEHVYKTTGNFFVAKSRLGDDGLKFPIIMDTSLSKTEIQEFDEEEETDQLERVREKFKELKKSDNYKNLYGD